MKFYNDNAIKGLRLLNKYLKFKEIFSKKKTKLSQGRIHNFITTFSS